MNSPQVLLFIIAATATAIIFFIVSGYLKNCVKALTV